MPETFSEDQKTFVNRPKGCFTTGTQNPIGMGLVLFTVGEKAYCDCAVPDRFRGFTKTAHGGIVCTLLDEIIISGISALENAMCATVEMKVTFRRPLFIDQPVQLQSWKTGQEGNKLLGRGVILDQDDKVIAEADVIMQRLDPEKARRFMPDETAEKVGRMGAAKS